MRVSSLSWLLFRKLWQVEKREASVIVKIWPSTGWLHVSKLPRASPDRSTIFKVQSGASATPDHRGAPLCPEDVCGLEPPSTILTPLPPRAPLHSEVLSTHRRQLWTCIFSGMQSYLTSTNDHKQIQHVKIVQFNILSISPRRHPCQAYTIFLLLREKGSLS